MIFQNTQKPKNPKPQTPKTFASCKLFLKIIYEISDSTFGVLLGRTGREA